VPTQIEPFHLSVPEAQLADLRERLARTRWPDKETVADTSQGPMLAKIQALCAYWQDGYDWRRAEKLLNGVGQFRTTIDGLGIHFLHVRSPEPDALPLIMTHGWPGSILEFSKIIGPLTDPAAHGGDPRTAFHLVLPSLPGFGFSDRPAEAGWGFSRIADAWITLMDRLGYHRWGAQGGDFGAAVSQAIAAKAPPGLAGMHLNFPMVQPTPAEIADATEHEQAMLASAAHYWQNLSAYSTMQSTRPQTVGYSLADSPTGLAAWMYSLFQDVGGTPGDAEGSFTFDEMLDDITLYWLTNTGASSARIYWEMMHSARPPQPSGPITVPAGFSIFPQEQIRASRRWLESRYSNIIHFNELPRGGHFAALEQPSLFTTELRTSFSTLR
jgi:microsomal epoxide hydrolase